MDERRTRTAMVALSAAGLPHPGELTAAYQEHWPDHEPLVCDDGTLAELAEEEPSELTCRTQGIEFVISLLPEAIPWSELSGPAETAWHWPEAEESLRPHVAHLLVTASSTSTLPVSELMLALTRVVAATAMTASAVGIYWKGATQVHKVEDFVHEADSARPDQLPLYLWLRFGLIAEPDATTSLHTTGLSELEQLELEFPHSSFDPQTLVDRAFNIAHYLLEKGPVLEHGQTIGISADERIAISIAPAMFEPTRRVYRLTLSGAAPKSPTSWS